LFPAFGGVGSIYLNQAKILLQYSIKKILSAGEFLGTGWLDVSR
jgi:hypothetical protein